MHDEDAVDISFFCINQSSFYSTQLQGKKGEDGKIPGLPITVPPEIKDKQLRKECEEIFRDGWGSMNKKEYDYGNTPLHKAAKQKDAAAVKFLLQMGANPQLKNHAGKTSEDYAREGRPYDLCLAHDIVYFVEVYVVPLFYIEVLTVDLSGYIRLHDLLLRFV